MTWETTYHAPVLAREVLELLGNASHVLDGTLGGGGHTAALLARGVRVTAIDRDPDAIASATARLGAGLDCHLGNYADLDLIPALDGVTFDGILLDLGVSSHQLDDESRGFTFRRGAPLDMRMTPDADQSAADYLNTADERMLEETLRQFADEPRARRLAREIVRRRESAPFQVSDDLVGAIRAVLGASAGPSDFARIFQGIRIAINHELDGLEAALPDLRDRLTPGGRLVVITYHSGEDRIVKHAFAEWSRACTCPPRHPICTCGGVALGSLAMRKAITASDEEVAANPRARSARLRAWQRAA
ncbi:MAG: 16S rRNA (cytosine(1402)-N(4))-methyltransferase RsmH [Gemmatimonadetes bacterium]|nr:16S rRNA (cytosine(1402)-N(4))-methyltransferase RsmH [Gemmatimonadota bacterium]